MDGTASVLEIVLTLALTVLVFGGLTGLALWGRARRRSGEEASRTNAKGAETILGNWFT